MPLAAVCQLNSGPDHGKNLAQACELVTRAAALGASLVSLPENFELMASSAEKLAQAEALDGPTLTTLRDLARALGITLLCGSFAEKAEDPTKVYNTSVVVGPDGAVLGIYRKIHLFDVELNDGAKYHESELVIPGGDAVTAETALGRLGMSVCYDLRFPELYRRLSSAGALLLSVPAAFTLMTGKDHWEVLLRARAIENQCYVIAAAQHGSHPGNRLTYGHSMIVDPWGTVLCCCPDGPGVAVAEIDKTALTRVRAALPALKHRRLDV
jgi:predicted amidohydrolase